MECGMGDTMILKSETNWQNGGWLAFSDLADHLCIQNVMTYVMCMN